MKTFSLIAAASVAFAFAGSAFASGENDYRYDQPTVSATQSASQTAKTRAEVLAELQQARQQGLLPRGEADWPVIAFVPQKTRAEVRAETLAAIASGELQAYNAESYSIVTHPAKRTSAALVTASK